MKSILVIDDDKVWQNLVEYYLKLAGYTVYKAFNADDGISLAKTYYPNLILLDRDMPNKDGAFVLRHLKSKEFLREIPVMMLTADSNPKFVSFAINNGAVDYMLKPMKGEMLLIKVKSAMQMHHLQKKRHVDYSEGEVRTNRQHGITMFTPMGYVTRTSLEKIKSIMTPNFRLRTKRDEYGLNLTYVEVMTNAELLIIEIIMTLMKPKQVRIIAGRHYSDLLNIGLNNEAQLFLNQEDLEKYVHHYIEKSTSK